jgi:hypothetical protein
MRKTDKDSTSPSDVVAIIDEDIDLSDYDPITGIRENKFDGFDIDEDEDVDLLASRERRFDPELEEDIDFHASEYEYSGEEVKDTYRRPRKVIGLFNYSKKEREEINEEPALINLSGKGKFKSLNGEMNKKKSKLTKKEKKEQARLESKAKRKASIINAKAARKQKKEAKKLKKQGKKYMSKTLTKMIKKHYRSNKLLNKKEAKLYTLLRTPFLGKSDDITEADCALLKFKHWNNYLARKIAESRIKDVRKFNKKHGYKYIENSPAVKKNKKLFKILRGYAKYMYPGYITGIEQAELWTGININCAHVILNEYPSIKQYIADRKYSLKKESKKVKEKKAKAKKNEKKAKKQKKNGPKQLWQYHFTKKYYRDHPDAPRMIDRRQSKEDLFRADKAKKKLMQQVYKSELKRARDYQAAREELKLNQTS